MEYKVERNENEVITKRKDEQENGEFRCSSVKVNKDGIVLQNKETKPEIRPILAKIAEQQLKKCLKKHKVPSKKLLDTLDMLKKLSSF